MKYVYYGWFAVIAACLVGCGGGGSSGNTSGGSSVAGDISKGYIFDYADDGTRSLVAVDPVNPSTRFTIASANSYHVLHTGVAASTFDATTLTFSEIRVGALLYESGGKLFKVSDTKPGTPIPVQVSDAVLLSVCPDPHSNSNLLDLDNTLIVYETGGLDGTCATTNDNEYKLIRLGMSPTDAPIEAKRVFASVTDETTQAPLGWLSAESGSIVFYENNFQNAQTLPEPYLSEPVELADNFFAMDNKVFKLIPASHTFKLVHTAPAGATISGQSAGDASDFYFARSDQKIFRIARDGNTPATEVYSGPELTGLQMLLLTDNRVVFRDGFDTNYSVPKTGTVASATLLGSGVGPPIVSATRVYYSELGPGVLKAVVVNEDGTGKVELRNAFFAGLITPTLVSFEQAVQPRITKLIRVENVDIASGSLAGASLKSIDGATSATIADLGKLPSGSYDFAFADNLQIGDGNFLHTYRGSISNAVASLFFNASQPGSLVSIN